MSYGHFEGGPAIMAMLFPLAWAVIWFGFVVIIRHQRRGERLRLLDMIEKASSEGRQVPPELLAEFRARGRTWVTDVRVGLILIAVAVGMCIAGLFDDYGYHGANPEVFYGPYKLFPIPGLIGLAFLITGWLRRREPDQS